MKTISSLTKGSKMEIQFIVYERNDDGLLLACKVFKAGKSYFTNISINFNELNNLIGKIPTINGIDVSELITNELLTNNDEISEINLKNKLGQTIMINDQLLAA